MPRNRKHERRFTEGQHVLLKATDEQPEERAIFIDYSGDTTAVVEVPRESEEDDGIREVPLDDIVEA